MLDFAGGRPLRRAARYRVLSLRGSRPSLGPLTVLPPHARLVASSDRTVLPIPRTTIKLKQSIQYRLVICKSFRSPVCSSDDVATGPCWCSCENPHPSSGRVLSLLASLQGLQGWTRHFHDLSDPIGIDNYSRSSQEGRLRLPQSSGGDGPCSICSPGLRGPLILTVTWRPSLWNHFPALR